MEVIGVIRHSFELHDSVGDRKRTWVNDATACDERSTRAVGPTEAHVAALADCGNTDA
jgi:hypothetical protein